ncbi:hypothetical protein [Streptomyces hawaiiensis]|uniref:Hydrolase n=1 Tax=Streptomyces hawaiiensis TaxID=67305 RepID=A0A6G5RA38_9ACTN|nr:hypothetical protein [Streptomyces hawaiiensis]QCD54689.1 hypothetical protein CEB94_07400 [Streptomyces hawaiiensis]
MALGDSLTEGVGDPVGDGVWRLGRAARGRAHRGSGLAADELRHRARGTSARLDLRASAAVSAALAGLSAAPAGQR